MSDALYICSRGDAETRRLCVAGDSLSLPALSRPAKIFERALRKFAQLLRVSASPREQFIAPRAGDIV
jgi:hypothetical protein